MLMYDGDWIIDIRRRNFGLKKKILLKLFFEIIMGFILLLRLVVLKIVISLWIMEMCFVLGCLVVVWWFLFCYNWCVFC